MSTSYVLGFLCFSLCNFQTHVLCLSCTQDPVGFQLLAPSNPMFLWFLCFDNHAFWRVPNRFGILPTPAEETLSSQPQNSHIHWSKTCRVLQLKYYHWTKSCVLQLYKGIKCHANCKLVTAKISHYRFTIPLSHTLLLSSSLGWPRDTRTTIFTVIIFNLQRVIKLDICL